MTEPLTNQQLVALVQEKTPDELSLEEIEQLRDRLRESPELQDVLIGQLQLETYLNHALGTVQVSIDDIVARAGTARSKRSRAQQLAWLLGLAVLLIAAGAAFFLNPAENDPAQPPDGNRPLAAAQANEANGALDNATPPAVASRPAAGNSDPNGVPVAPPEAEKPLPPWKIVLEAEEFSRSNLHVDDKRFGKGIGILHSDGRAPSFAEYDIELPRDGIYQLEMRYASDEPRPLRLRIDGKLIREDAGSRDTGDWMPDHQREFVEARIRLTAGAHTLQFETVGYFPNLDKLALYQIPEFTSEQYNDTGSLPVLALRDDPEGEAAEKIVAAVDTGPAPWEAALSGELEPLALEKVMFSSLPAKTGQPLNAARLNRWFKAAPGHAYRIGETRSGSRVFASFEGVAQLAAPWPEGAVLRLGIWEPVNLKIHFWNGNRGVSLEYHERRPLPIWAAWSVTREGNSARPDTRTLLTTDSRRFTSSSAGPFDLRIEHGSLLMVRGDIVLLKVPLPDRPDEIFVDGRMKVAGIEMFRGEPFPPLPENSRPVVFQPRPEEAARWTGQATLLPVDQFEVRPEGSVALAVQKDSRDNRNEMSVAAVGTPLGRYGLYEVIALLKGNAPGTGIYLGDPEGVPVHHIGFMQDRRTGRPAFGYAWTQNGYQRSSSNGLSTDLDPAAFPWPYAGDETWVRIVVGPGGLKLWTSGDGEFWGEAAPAPVPQANTPFASVGIYAVRDNEARRVELKQLQVRELSAITSLADADLQRQLPPFLPNDRQTFEMWLARAIATRPAAAGLDDWLRTAAIETLASGVPQPTANAIMRGLLESGLHESRPAEERWRFLDEMCLIADANSGQDAFALAQAYLDLSIELADQGQGGTFVRAARQLIEAPIWSTVRIPASPSTLVRRGVLENAHLGRWTGARTVSDPLRFWMTPAQPDPGWQTSDREKLWLLDWIDAHAAMNAREAPLAESLPIPVRWRHPLETLLSKEAFNLMAEFESALESRAYQDACQIISTAGIGGLLGLLPDAKEPDLFVSLPRAVALAVGDHPDLHETLKTEFGPIGLLRVRQAITEANIDAIETATIQFYGTEAACEARRWLGDRALAAGKFAQAVDQYREGARFASPGLKSDLLARRRLAAAMLGKLVGTPIAYPVEIGGTSFTPDDFEKLVVELSQSHAPAASRGSDELASITGLRRGAVPAPGAYVPQSRGWVEGELGKNPQPSSSGQDSNGRELAVVEQDGVMYVSNRFQVAAYSADNGQLKWRAGLGGEQGEARRLTFVPMQPVIVDSVIYVRRISRQGVELACLDRQNGQVKWKSPRELVPISDPVFSRERLLVLVSSIAQSGQIQVELANLHPETGALLSQNLLFRLRDEWGQSPGGQLISAAGRLLAVAGGAVASFDHTGNVHWIRRQPWLSTELDRLQYEQYIEPPIAIEDRVWVMQPGVRSIACLELESGRQIWEQPLPEVQRLIAIVDGLLIVQETGALTAWEAGTGKFVWRKRFDLPLDGVLAGGPHGLLVTCRVAARDAMVHPALVWIDPATGNENSRCVLDTLKERALYLGPLVAASGRLWGFYGREGKDVRREVLELVPSSGGTVPFGPHSHPDLLAWSAISSPLLQHELSRQLPGWTLISPQNESKTGLQQNVLGQAKVFTTRLEQSSQASLIRSFDVPADGNPRLKIRAGHEAGRNWQLQIRIDNEVALKEDLTDQSAGSGWLDKSIDLKPYAGRRIWITATHRPAAGEKDLSKVSGGYWQQLEMETDAK